MKVSGICRIVFPVPPNLTKIVFSCIKKKIWRERVGEADGNIKNKKEEIRLLISPFIFFMKIYFIVCSCAKLQSLAQASPRKRPPLPAPELPRR